MLGSRLIIFAVLGVALSDNTIEWTEKNLAFHCKFPLTSHIEIPTDSYDECSTRCSRDLVCTYFQWTKTTCTFFKGEPDKEDAVFDDDKNSVCGIAPPADKVDDDCTCSGFQSRIVNGTLTAPHNFKFQVGIIRSMKSVPFCGGSLISKSYVITAAHCVVGKLPSKIKVVVGEHNYLVSGDEEAYHVVESILVHPDYDYFYSDYDFALIKLSKEVTIGSKVGIICLPTGLFESYDGTDLIVTGWGTTQFGGEQSPVLRQTIVKGVDSEVCASKYNENSKITNQMLCAENPGTDSCQGDSGGPLFTLSKSKTTLVGLVSFGRGCADPDYPGVYARVSSVIPWIYLNSDAKICQK